MTFSRVSVLIMVLTLSYAGASASVLAQAPDWRPVKTCSNASSNLSRKWKRCALSCTKLRNELVSRELAGTASGRPSRFSFNEGEFARLLTGAERPQTAAAEKHLPGIDLGPVRAVPYGTIYFNAFGNSGGTNNADDPLFATPTNQGNVEHERASDAIGT